MTRLYHVSNAKGGKQESKRGTDMLVSQKLTNMHDQCNITPLHWKELIMYISSSNDGLWESDSFTCYNTTVLHAKAPTYLLYTRKSHFCNVRFRCYPNVGCVLSISSDASCIHNFFTLGSLPCNLVNPYHMHDGVPIAITIINSK